MEFDAIKARCKDFKDSKFPATLLDKPLASARKAEFYASKLRKSRRNDVLMQKRTVLVPARDSFKPAKVLIDCVPVLGSDSIFVLSVLMT